MIYPLKSPESRKAHSLIPLQQLADEACVHVKTLRNEVERGKLIAMRVGRQLRVRQSDWEKYLSAGITTLTGKGISPEIH